VRVAVPSKRRLRRVPFNDTFGFIFDRVNFVRITGDIDVLHDYVGCFGLILWHPSQFLGGGAKLDGDFLRASVAIDGQLQGVAGMLAV
jgi:hypothetical protein